MTKLLVLLVLAGFAAGCGADASGKPSGGANMADKIPSAYPPVSSVIMKSENRLLDGSPLKLEDLKGKVVVLNLWATWCGPCREEIPHLVELKEKFGADGFEVVGLDVDPETKEEIEAFTSQMKVNYTIGWANEELTVGVMKLNQMSGVPQSILIDRDGNLKGIFRGAGPNVIKKMKESVAKEMEKK